MLIYILMIMISIFFSIIAKKVNSKKLYVLFAILSAMPFVLVSSIRYDVGTDYMYRYITDYNLLKGGYELNNLEIGFRIIDNIAISLDNYQWIFIITSIIINSFVFYIIFKDSKNTTLSIIIYFIGAFFFQSLNMTRQYISMTALLCSYKYITDKKWIKFSIVVLLATLFHTTSLIFGIIIFIINVINKIRKKDTCINEKIIIFLVVIVILAAPLIRELIHEIITLTKYSSYIGSSFDHGDLQIIPFAINILLYIIMVYIIKKCKEKTEISDIDKFFINMQALVIIFFALGNTTVLSMRIAYFFSIFQIISIPHFLDYVKEKFGKRNYFIYVIIIELVFSTSLVWTHVIHKSDEVLPYKTVFNKEYKFQ